MEEVPVTVPALEFRDVYFRYGRNSRDVLAGMIVSLLGQGLEPLEAAACGAWLHGAAGDLCAADMGQYGMLPSDMVEALPRLLK